jgi:transcriptional regulator with XRE-family HTH domain
MNMSIKGITEQDQKTLRQRLGDRIRLLRFQRGWSQEVLAELSGLHRNYVGHVERGEVNTGFRNVYQLAAAFELTVSEFLKDI